MSTSAYDSTMTNSRDLESLRTRLWRLSWCRGADCLPG